MKSLWTSVALAVLALGVVSLTATSAHAQAYGAYPYRGPLGQPSIGMGAYVWPSATRYLGRYNYPSYYNTPYTNTASIPFTYDPGYNPYVTQQQYFAAQQYTNNQSTIPQYNLGPAFQTYNPPGYTTAGSYLRYYGTPVNQTSSPVYNSTGGTYYGPGYAYP